MATLLELKTAVAQALRDPFARTFDDANLSDIVNASLVEIGRIAPEQFHESITIVADTLEYVVRSSQFGGVAVPEIEVARVELWESVVDEPDKRLMTIPPAARAYSMDTQGGWINWGGTLYLPRSVWSAFDGNEATYYLRVWGYSPFPALTLDEDIATLSNEQKWALIDYARLEGLERLNADRELFTQWQTRAGNTDVSPAGLMSMLSAARDNWRRKKRELLRLRSAV